MRCVSVESVRQLETSHDTGWAKKTGQQTHDHNSVKS